MGVATNRKPGPQRYALEQALDEEVAAIFKGDPEFKERLGQTVERVRLGDEHLVPDAEVRRRLKRVGLSLGDDAEA